MSDPSTESAPGTGRLFRSLRAEGHSAEAAIPALSLDQAVGLRSVTLGGGTAGPIVDAPAVTSPTPPATAAPTNGANGAAPAGGALASPNGSGVATGVAALEYAEVAPRPQDDRDEAPAAGATGRRGAHATPGLKASGVWLVIIGVTVVMGFADALVMGRTGLGWLTGLSLLLVSIYGAFVVRRDDAIVAVIAPPLAFFLATITAGQLTLPPTGDLLVREAFMIVTTLGNNAVWIFGSTIVALVIVLVRRRRGAAGASVA